MAAPVRIGWNVGFTSQRADDAAVISLLNGVPFSIGDGFDDERDSNERMRLRLLRNKIDTVRRYWGIGDPAKPDGFDNWAASIGMWPVVTITMALSSETQDRVSFYEFSDTAIWDAVWTATSGRIKTWMDTYDIPGLVLGWTHEPGHDYKLKYESLNARTPVDTQIQLRTRTGLGILKTIPAGTVLSFAPAAQNGNPPFSGTVTFNTQINAVPPNYPTPTNCLNVVITGNIAVGDIANMETLVQQQANYRNGWPKFVSIFENTVGAAWPKLSRIQYVLVLYQNAFNGIANWWPGDQYVDVLGVDIYNEFGDQGGIWEDFQDIYEPEARDFAVSHGKRVWICEMGCLEGVPITVTGGPYGPGANITIQSGQIGSDQPAGQEIVCIATDPLDLSYRFTTTIVDPIVQSQVGGPIKLANVPVQLVAGDKLAIRPPGKSRAQWMDNLTAYIKTRGEIDGLLNFHSTAGDKQWEDEAPYGSMPTIEAFRRMALDPHFRQDPMSRHQANMSRVSRHPAGIGRKSTHPAVGGLKTQHGAGIGRKTRHGATEGRKSRHQAVLD